MILLWCLMIWRNKVYDSVLVAWKYWINIGDNYDSTGLRYTAETGGNPANWLAGSYSCEGFYPEESFKAATKTHYVVPGTPSATGYETGTAENPFRTIAAAFTVCAFGDSVFLFSGNYAETGLLLPSGVSLIGEDRETVSLTSAGPTLLTFTGGVTGRICRISLYGPSGTAVIAVNACELHVSDILYEGVITLNGNAGAIYGEGIWSNSGRIDIVSGNANTRLKLWNTHIVGGVADLYAIRIADADPFIDIVDGCYLQGTSNAGGSPAIYWDTITNNNLRLKRSGIYHGAFGANLPFGRSGVQAPMFKAVHCDFTHDPETGLVWVNMIPPGQRYNTIDAGMGW